MPAILTAILGFTTKVGWKCLCIVSYFKPLQNVSPQAQNVSATIRIGQQNVSYTIYVHMWNLPGLLGVRSTPSLLNPT